MSRTTGSADVERIYDRIAALYDLLNAPMERLGGDRRRRRLLARARGDVLEVGIGTGRNLPHYPEGVELTGIDLSERMLERARERAHDLDRDVRLMRADVERLPFEDDCFDTVTAACVFCSVADALQGLREVRRVVKPKGRVLLLEHVRPRNPLIGKLFDFLSPLTRRLMGPEINRRTEETVRAAGFEIEEVRREGIWREIVARKAA